MKTNVILTAAACASMFLTANFAKAQETVVVEQESVTLLNQVECKDHYNANWRKNWFIQLGAGVQSPFVEDSGERRRRMTATYNLGVGRWISPYLGFRINAYYGRLHWNQHETCKATEANLNLDFMWDMFNSIGGYKANRVFSIVPYVGLGGSFVYDIYNPQANIVNRHNHIRHTEWTMPVSAGLQFRFRLCEYVDFFAEGRASFHGDNFNNCIEGWPLDIVLRGTGGFTFYVNGRGFEKYNPCDYLGYVNELNGKINNLRGELAATTAALAAAEAQLPCPEVVEATVVENVTPILSTVRFKINSAEVTDEEIVNVFNVAQWMKANPNATITVQGYADRDTGTAEYNQELSNRRAQNVLDILVNDFGISESRLKINANGSAVQPYAENNWNRIVIFTQP